MNDDVYDKIFNVLLQLIRQGIANLDVKFLTRWWHLSALLGSRGQVIAGLLSDESLGLFERIKLSSLRLGITHRGFEDTIMIYKLERLASLLVEGNEAKLTSLCSRSEYKSVYHLLKLEKKIEDERTFILYAYFRMLTSDGQIDLQAMARSYVSRTSGFHHRTELARHLQISVERFLERRVCCRPK